MKNQQVLINYLNRLPQGDKEMYSVYKIVHQSVIYELYSLFNREYRYEVMLPNNRALCRTYTLFGAKYAIYKHVRGANGYPTRLVYTKEQLNENF